MKIRFSTLLFILLFPFSIMSNNELEELIRQKIENLDISNKLTDNVEVFCVSSLKKVYLTENFKPFWTEKSKIAELINIIKSSYKEGLVPEDYHLSEISKLSEVNNIENRANLEIILTDAFLLYSSHLLAGKTDPVNIDPSWHVVKIEKNPEKYIYKVKTTVIKEIIKDIIPVNDNYDALKEQLAYLRGLERSGFELKIEEGPVLRPGMVDPRIPKIKQILSVYEYYNNEQINPASKNYDDTLKQAVINFQKNHGLEALGTIGEQTIEALNTSVSSKIQKIIINLERIRWLPRETPSNYLNVNIANFELKVFNDNKLIQQHKAIVGKPYRRTPVFSAEMQYLVFNPTWQIPPGILRNDIIPEIQKSTDYLAKKHIVVYDKQNKRINTDTVDWSNPKTLKYNYIQQPGRDNALGVVKFMFPNKYNVYLHDTPSKELFQKTERAFSSGCIRIDNPIDLAEYLLEDQPGYSRNEILRIISLTKTKTIVLTNKPIVFLIYLTTWVDDTGLNFRKDIYNRDDRIYEALQSKPVYTRY